MPSGKLRRRIGGKPQATDFRRAATDVEDEGAGGFRGQKRRAARESERGFFATGNDFELDAGLPPGTSDECLTVARTSAGFGGNSPGMADAVTAHLAGADAQGFDGAVHGRFGQCASRIDALAQTDDAGEGIDDAK